MRKRIHLIEAPIILLLIAAAFYWRLDRLPFHVDESHWIGLSASFEAFFHGRFTDPIWQDRQDKYLNAPITHYVVGAARQVGGWPAEMLNAPARFGVSYDENLAQGRVPAPGLLWWGRAGVTTAAIAAIFVSFVLFARASTRWAAYVWLALTLASPYLRYVARLAMSEGVLLGTLALVMWATYKFLSLIDAPHDNRVRWKSAGWLALAGIASGLAAQTKINGGVAVLGVLLVAAMASCRVPMDWTRRCALLSLAAAILAACSAGAFIGTNPTLWPHPARETLRVVRARAEVMRDQVARSATLALPTFSDRMRVVPRRVFYDDAIVRGMYSTVVFFLAGLGWTAVNLARWLRKEHENHALVVLTVIGMAVSVPALFTPLDWPRYFLLPVFFSSFQIVLGLHVLARWIWRASLHVSRRGL
jgi:hypothetical protein